ncbi:TPA: winged helix-turn-helix domain-containing protein [Staphylococcus aureus]|uniref:helix-turn-helix domain-containing protein n=1 Tax=Staphylococcus TaxID=1279 RepID=UPI000B7EF6A9|nr:helix-turn-helix domain-containing protein [Staphylococcus aureus]HCV9176723.1 winged helix-turn-helix domain-containing protein [Staphylococcus aureus]HCV9485057.1 winged helix-turn-helix domain-containing protein [Staphylococcus aureus]HDA2604461.1 winged helix-turn-helix domain-containing protein [Staphylococcus aureus]HDE0229988.1 winged helix-turn-helix domain-containing protein [Staphylococcus aureus]HEE8759917.1 winged helix-turn-helix domain-containing protein [Staphylococcus aureus
MNNKFYIYKCFFEKDPYIHLNMKQKFLLSIIYSVGDEDGYLHMEQKRLGEMINLSRQSMNTRLSYLLKKGILIKDKNKMIKIKRPQNRESIPLSEEFVSGKYQYLSEGAKIFYAYYFYIQKMKEADYLKIKGTDIGKPLNLNVRSIQKYYIELENAGLLIKSKDVGMNKLQFLEI